MFVLKVVVFSSALLNVGSSTTRCDPKEIVEFQCQDPTCRVLGNKFMEGQMHPYKNKYFILGFSNDKFLVKNHEEILSIVHKNQLKVKAPFKSHYTFNVSIHKMTFEVCDTRDQRNEENHNDSTTAQINTNTDETNAHIINNVEVSKDNNMKSLDEPNETIKETDSTSSFVHNDYSHEDYDESLEIETEDEFNTNDHFVKSPSNVDENTAEIPVNESLLAHTNQIKNSESVDPEKINQDNIANPQGLENDSATECAVGACEEDTLEFNKLIFTKESANNISPVETDDSYQQIHYVEETDSSIEKSFNNTALQNSSTINLQKNNDTTNFNTEGSNQQTNKHSSNSLETDSSSEESVNNLIPHNSSTVDLQDGNVNFNIESPNQQKDEQIPIIKQLPNLEKTDNFIDKFNTMAPQNSSTLSLQVNSMEDFNETQPQKNTNSDSLQDTIKVVNQQDDNSYKQALEKNNDSDVVNDNVSSSTPVEEKLRDYGNPSTIIETSKMQSIDNSKEIEGDLPVESNDHIVPEFQNTFENILSNNEFVSNDDSVDGNITHLSPLQNVKNEIDTTSSTDYETIVADEVVVTEMNKKVIDQCTSESGCEHSVDSTSKHSYESDQHHYKSENKVLPYENVYTSVKPNINENVEEFESKSYVTSFSHPDTCSGVNCLTFKRNTEKVVKSSKPSNSVSDLNQDATLHPTNTKFEKENLIVKQYDEESSIFDIFQKFLSSPTLNSIDFLWNIFDSNPDQTDNKQETLGYFKRINHSELYFIVAAVVTLLFSLIYYKYQKGTYQNHLLTLLAAKEQNLLIVEKELSLLKEQSSGSTILTTERNLEIETLNEHLTKSEDIITSQALRIEKLEQDIEELTENGIEMHTLLSFTLESNTKNTEKCNALKVALVDLENLVAALKQKNFEKTTELEKKNDVIKTFETNIDELINKNISLIGDNAKISLQLEQITTKATLKESKLLSEINNLKFELDKQTNALITAENEVLLSKDALQEMMSQKFNPADVKKFSSSLKLSAELKSVKQICEGYKQKLDEALKTNQQHLDHIDNLKIDIVTLKDTISKLEKEKGESLNKLNILTTFFKEQEKEYLRQIDEKAMLCDNKEWESSDLHGRVKSLNQEIANYKSEIHSLKKEITDQEASFKIQISAADKKASDNWISFRQAERKLKEMELEAAQLRNKLTMVDKKLENGTKSIDSSKDFEDELLDIPLPTISPDFTLLDFEPPPPILTNERLPPLGALGQAPSPPVPLSRRHNRSLSPSSPPPSQRSSIFRPLAQRYNYMNRQNSLGHSVESLDK